VPFGAVCWYLSEKDTCLTGLLFNLSARSGYQVSTHCFTCLINEKKGSKIKPVMTVANITRSEKPVLNDA
jgi:hypothetical protein